MEAKVISKMQLGNFIVALEAESEAIIFSCVPTDQNNGGSLLAIYRPLQDYQIYPLLRTIYNHAIEGDENSKTLLHLKVCELKISRDLFPVDVACVKNLSEEAKACYGRIASIINDQQKTSEESLDELAEREEIENRIRAYSSVVTEK